MTERLLLGPGPSNAAPEVLASLSDPLVGHMDPAFLDTLDRVSSMLREVMRTSNRLTFAVSATGSGGMEAAIVNLVEPGDTAIVCVNGVFGSRMTEVAARAGARVVTVEAPWGSPVDPQAVASALDSHPDARLVGIVHAETSTGTRSDVQAVAAAVSGRALLVVDAVTSLGGMPLEVDGWGIDVCYSGTQKCLSVPPGLAPITFSDRAIERVRSRTSPVRSWYLDVTMLERYWGSDRVYHHTAPISMVNALEAGLRLVLDEGLEARWDRHRRVASELGEALEARGFTYVPHPDHRLPMLHCVRVPDGFDEAAERKRLLTEHGIEVGGGLGAFAGTCWRIGLMGHNARTGSVTRLLDALDRALV
ncbi:MAG TPA: alanine--glyoxylate aminotransferase family protein [Actinomycetota bacterium]|nr:alanine--glyoxylate aminotransferase family protein [Actinomycetota bacterium]